MVEYSQVGIEPSDGLDRMQDWRQAIQLPTAYRIGNSTVRLQYQFVVGVVVVGVLALFLFYNFSSLAGSRNRHVLENRIPVNYDGDHFHKLKEFGTAATYNSTYPLTSPVRTDKGLRYRVAIIADLDAASKKGEEWISYLKSGSLFVDVENSKVS